MATAVNCSPSRRTVPSGNSVLIEVFHWHLCACGAVVFCTNDPCWRWLTVRAGVAPSWPWRCASCRNGGAQ